MCCGNVSDCNFNVKKKKSNTCPYNEDSHRKNKQIKWLVKNAGVQPLLWNTPELRTASQT